MPGDSPGRSSPLVAEPEPLHVPVELLTAELEPHLIVPTFDDSPMMSLTLMISVGCGWESWKTLSEYWNASGTSNFVE